MVLAVRPPDDVLAAQEDTPALRAMLADPATVAAYDKVPATAATAVFSLDKRTDVLLLHAGSAQPAGGGTLNAHGRMWVAAEAETDPRAVFMQVRKMSAYGCLLQFASRHHSFYELQGLSLRGHKARMLLIFGQSLWFM